MKMRGEKGKSGLPSIIIFQWKSTTIINSYVGGKNHVTERRERWAGGGIGGSKISHMKGGAYTTPKQKCS
jgi:hypothetical protein